MTRRTDSGSRLIQASTEAIYGALIDPKSLIAWLPPGDMSGRILLFEPWVGGRYSIELTYATGEFGKTTANSDISSGRFLAFDPGRIVSQSVEFESDDDAFAGEMIMTWSLEPQGTAALVTVTAENVPPGISPEDHAEGIASSLENLAAFVEARGS
jgi:uncharacterized protein YndB with AHSA1/START domain